MITPDAHTHIPKAHAVVNLQLHQLATPLRQDFTYSVGIHPWETGDLADLDSAMTTLRDFVVAHRHQVVAIGECGIDTLRGAPVEFQQEVLRLHIALSEEFRLPLVIHCVHAYSTILSLHKSLRPTQAWIIHGFRAKPGVAVEMARRGIYMSMGKRFNPDTLLAVPDTLLLAETDATATAADTTTGICDDSSTDIASATATDCDIAADSATGIVAGSDIAAVTTTGAVDGADIATVYAALATARRQPSLPAILAANYHRLFPRR